MSSRATLLISNLEFCSPVMRILCDMFLTGRPSFRQVIVGVGCPVTEQVNIVSWLKSTVTYKSKTNLIVIRRRVFKKFLPAMSGTHPLRSQMNGYGNQNSQLQFDSFAAHSVVYYANVSSVVAYSRILYDQNPFSHVLFLGYR